MGFSHHYAAIKEVKEGDEAGEDIKYQPQPPSTSITIAWWKFLLCNLLAASAGAAAMFLVGGGFDAAQPGTNVAPSVDTSNTLPAALTIPTPSVELVEGAINGQPSQNALAGVILDCGYSPEEARAKGCVYDVMMQDWVPEPCYDAALTEKYLAKGNYTWYADGDGNVTISDEVMRKGEHGAAWMSSAYHKAHCVFSWLKIIRALRNDWGISQELLSYDHVMHCEMGALKEKGENVGLGVKAPTNYAKCALYDTWKVAFIPDQHDSTER